MQCNESRSGEQAVDIRQCLFWELFSSGACLAAFLISYFLFLIVSAAINCYLLYLTVRHRHPNQHYAILQNLAVCNFLIVVTPSIYLLPNVLQGKTAALSNWCISFLGIMGSFLLACQVTLVLVALERYIFICHRPHYHRIRKGHVRCALGVIWGLVGLLNINYGVLFGRKWRYDDKPTETLICDSFIFEKHTELTSIDMLQLHGPSSFIVILSIVIIFACYLQMFRAVCKVSPELRQSDYIAASTVALYLVMVLVSMLPMCWALAMLSLEEAYYPQNQFILIFLTTVPPSVNAAIPVYCTADFKRSLLSLCRHSEDEGPEYVQRREFPQRRGILAIQEQDCETETL